jgi:hypothetical protein
MRTRLILAMAMLWPFIIHAQYKGKITGKIVDAKDKQVLEGATVSVLDSAAGIYIKHAVSNAKGEFTVTSLPFDTTLQVIVSFTGYRDSSAMIRIRQKNKILDIGTWKLVAGDELEAVTVTARRPPFVVKKDTLEFNATAFKTLPTDMVQDLLRKLPGVVVDLDGNVTVNGQRVDKIQVDGRDFFNPNIKTALENLPGAIIEKVQVTPSKEKAQAETSLITPADKGVTINLQLKKANRKGSFGHVGAGYGTQQLYQGDAFMNYFSQGNRLSAKLGARKGNQGGYLGQQTSWGVNANQMIGKKITMDASYQGSDNRSQGTTSTERLNILPDSSFLVNNQAASFNRNQEHQLNANVDVNIDTLQRLNIRAALAYTDNTGDMNNQSVSTTTENGELINSQVSRQQNNTQRTAVNHSASYYKSSRDRRTSFSVNWNMNLEQERGTLNNQSLNQFSMATDTINQYGNTLSNRLGNNFSIVLNQKIGKHFMAIAQYGFSQNDERLSKYIFDKGAGLDSTVSNVNRNSVTGHSPNMRVGYAGKKLTVELGAGWNFVQQENEFVWKDSSLKFNQKNFTPFLNSAWRFAKQSSLAFEYSVYAQPPAAQQLTPVVDNTNPLAIIVGNPDLQSSFTQNMNITLQWYSPDLRWFGNARGGGTFNDQPIVMDSRFDDSGRQVTTWRNAASGKNLSLNVTLGRSVRVGEWNWQFNVEGRMTHSDDPGFINGELNKVRNIQINPGMRVNMNYGTILSMNLEANISSYHTSYMVSKVNDLKYDNKQVQFNCNWMPIKKLQIAPGISYYFNAQLPKEFQRSQTLLNASVNYFFLKSNKLALGISVNDILNKGVTTTRQVTPTSIVTSQVNTVRRFGFFTARYRLSRFGGSEM